MVTVLGIVTFRVFPPKMGGQKGVALFYKYLSRHMEVKLALTGENDPIHAKAYGVAITPMLFPNKSIYANLSRLNTLEKLVQQAQAQVLISEHSYPGFMALWIKQRTGKPFIIHSHNIEALRFKQMGRVWWKAYFIYERWIHRKADFNFFISEKDQAFALKEFGLSPEKCAVITYGIVQQRLPVGADKKIIKRHLGLQDSELLFLFNGTLDYAPNIDAVKGLINQLTARLANRLPPFKIVITGNRASRALIQSMEQNPRILFRGFAEDIDAYYTAADLFLNPVINDSGVKTKLIEALANNCMVVSFAAGATGIPAHLIGKKLITVADGDYAAFAQEIINGIKKEPANTPQAFYDYYNWDNIALKAAQCINKVVEQHG